MALGYGVDIWCLDSIVTGRLARGAAVLMQALYGRLTTERGTLRGGDEEARYGYDVTQLIGRIGYDSAIAPLRGIIAAELAKDDRVESVRVDVSKVQEDNGLIYLSIAIEVTPKDETGDFTFTLAATDVSLDVLDFSLPEAA